MNMMQSNQLMEDELEAMNDGAMNDGNNRSDNKSYAMYDRNAENSSALSYSNN
jgi:hypothetical protein